MAEGRLERTCLLSPAALGADDAAVLEVGLFMVGVPMQLTIMNLWWSIFQKTVPTVDCVEVYPVSKFLIWWLEKLG